MESPSSQHVHTLLTIHNSWDVRVSDKGGIQGENLSPSTSIWAWMCLGSSLVLLLLSIALHIPLDTVTSRADDRTKRLFKTNNLYRPNMYIGLERLNTTISRMALPEKLDVFPHVFAPVSKRYPDLVYPSNGRSRITFNGLVSPGEPHIIINKDVKRSSHPPFRSRSRQQYRFP